MRIVLGNHRAKSLRFWVPDDHLRWRAAGGARDLQEGPQNRLGIDENGVCQMGRCGVSTQVSRSVRWDRVSAGDCAFVGLKEECGQERLKGAVDRLGEMDSPVDSATYATLLRCCGNARALWDGKRVHGHIIGGGLDGDRFLGNLLVQMYGKCGCLGEARGVFDKMGGRNTFSWNIMIQAYAQNGCGKEALELFRQMQQKGVEPTKITFITILNVCACLTALEEGKESHATILDRGFEADVVVGTALVNVYGKCGKLHEARSVFDKMPQRDVICWNAMIAAYTKNGQNKEALEFFQQMKLKGLAPDKITFISVLDACAGLTSLAEGKQNHADIINRGFERDVIVGNSLVNMYGKCGSLDGAQSVFDKMHQHNVISWTAMITAYVQNGNGKKALKLFRKMQLKGMAPDQVTFGIILDACTSLADLAEGKENHAAIIDRGFETDIVMGNALVNMYGRCGCLGEARSVFDRMPQHNAVSWTAMIVAYSQNGHSKESLELFTQMQLRSIAPDKITFVSILDACASLTALAEGKESHSSIIVSGFEMDVVVGTALVNMYGKCGRIDDARFVFDKMPQHDVVSWSAMIASYAQNGYGDEALELFQQMQLEDMKPNMITFINILSGCSHAGLLDDGWHCFVSMNKEYTITPTAEHFVCMIDLFGRAGQLDEAEYLLRNMPFGPNSVAWMGLLGACRIYGDVERGTHAAEYVLELDPMNAGPFILLSNIYAASGKWDHAAEVRKVMKERGVKAQPAHSCIEVKQKVHEFLAGDKSHAQKEEIC